MIAKISKRYTKVSDFAFIINYTLKLCLFNYANSKNKIF